VGHECATRALTSLDATTRKHSHEAALPVSAFFGPLPLILITLFLSRLPPLTQEMGNEGASNATTTQHAAANQQAQEATLLISAFLAHALLTTLILLVLLPSLT